MLAVALCDIVSTLLLLKQWLSSWIIISQNVDAFPTSDDDDTFHSVSPDIKQLCCRYNRKTHCDEGIIQAVWPPYLQSVMNYLPSVREIQYKVVVMFALTKKL